MKARLLKKLRKKYPVYYSREVEVTHSKTGKPLIGRFMINDIDCNTRYYYENKAEAIKRRRKSILRELEQMRNDNNKKYKIINL